MVSVALLLATRVGDVFCCCCCITGTSSDPEARDAVCWGLLFAAVTREVALAEVIVGVNQFEGLDVLGEEARGVFVVAVVSSGPRHARHWWFAESSPSFSLVLRYGERPPKLLLGDTLRLLVVLLHDGTGDPD
ncbi:hypothetical protein BDB00DRAFT_815085 [Zychaea mexicana]|uniref:uncharacterized protein n=1 Tax=Zychaea mexicana TaxID=64656 RepID=UPI0022FE5B4D|nr:uncharacterized protein BDB00DRAFT_815085 [Zychaea mexicana]KAI9495202.1 hypothetical protein BDB00DRAFT_815085 [Zychaea mexicana]